MKRLFINTLCTTIANALYKKIVSLVFSNEKFKMYYLLS